MNGGGGDADVASYCVCSGVSDGVCGGIDGGVCGGAGLGVEVGVGVVGGVVGIGGGVGVCGGVVGGGGFSSVGGGFCGFCGDGFCGGGFGDVGLTCVSLELAPGPRQQQGAGIPHISSTSTSINLTCVAQTHNQPHICCPTSQLTSHLLPKLTTSLKFVAPHS